MDADAVVLGDREQVIDDVEPLLAARIVDPGDLHQLLILELVAQDRHHLDQRLAPDRDRDFLDGILRLKEGVAERGLYLVDYRSEEPTSELQSLMRISYAVFCL